MEPTAPTNGATSFWKTLPGILTAVAAFVTAVGTLIGALAAAGALDRGQQPAAGSASVPAPSSSTTAAPEPPPTVVPGPPTAVPAPQTSAVALASIDIVYTGDQYGCVLNLVFEVGGQTVQPSGSRFPVRNVQPGVQQYEVRGSISCATLGNCAANGSGVVDVNDGDEYYVTWLNTSIGGCDVTLNE
jgi:hypothetical protein